MSELVCVSSFFKTLTPEHYAAKKKSILAHVDPRKELVNGGMIYCKLCRGEKLADMPQMNFITKASCECEVRRWEQERERMKNPPRAKELRKGDWNPFD